MDEKKRLTSVINLFYQETLNVHAPQVRQVFLIKFRFYKAIIAELTQGETYQELF